MRCPRRCIAFEEVEWQWTDGYGTFGVCDLQDGVSEDFKCTRLLLCTYLTLPARASDPLKRNESQQVLIWVRVSGISYWTFPMIRFVSSLRLDRFQSLSVRVFPEGFCSLCASCVATKLLVLLLKVGPKQEIQLLMLPSDQSWHDLR